VGRQECILSETVQQSAGLVIDHQDCRFLNVFEFAVTPEVSGVLPTVECKDVVVTVHFHAGDLPEDEGRP
jgi:hypothetical protein